MTGEKGQVSRRGEEERRGGRHVGSFFIIIFFYFLYIYIFPLSSSLLSFLQLLARRRSDAAKGRFLFKETMQKS